MNNTFKTMSIKIILCGYIMITNISCSVVIDRRTIELNDKPTIVIDTSSTDDEFGKIYYIKLYNGKDTEWFKTTYNDYKKIKLNDTLTNYIIK